MAAQILQKYKYGSEKAVQWLMSHFEEDGSYGSSIQDLASYYKSPYLLYLSGKVEESYQLLTYIKNKFMQDNGDFVTAEDIKSENEAFGEYWAYINGWLALTAQKLGRFDIAYPAYQYLTSFYHPKHGGFTTNKPYGQADNVVDVLSTAHLGLTALYFGDLEKANSAGELLQRFVSMQPDIKQGFYLRLNDAGKIITDFPQQASIFFKVSTLQPDQAYFMVGYPIAFLGKLYQATHDRRYLDTAKRYLDFAFNCHDNLRTCHFSHKVAWGAAIVAKLTGEQRFADLATDITDYLLNIQDTKGGWLQEQPAHTSFDQTAEIAIWLREIAAELSTEKGEGTRRGLQVG
jgi:hypothetical protein